MFFIDFILWQAVTGSPGEWGRPKRNLRGCFRRSRAGVSSVIYKDGLGASSVIYKDGFDIRGRAPQA